MSNAKYMEELFVDACANAQHGILPNVWAGYKHPDYAVDVIENYLDTIESMGLYISFHKLSELCAIFDSKWENASSYLRNALAEVMKDRGVSIMEYVKVPVIAD